MGKRGPAGKPTRLRVLHGDRPDRINTDEPEAPDGLPEALDDMSDEVREIWDYTLDQIDAMGLASPADRDVLRAYCEAVATHRQASRALAKSGLLIRTARGNQFMRNPLIAVQRDSATLVRVLAREFGLTPSARAGISVTGSADDGAGPERLLS